MSTALRRLALCLMTVATFTVAATGCGREATGSAQVAEHAILGYVPREAVMYAIADWQQAEQHADAFPALAAARDDMFRGMRASDEPVDYERDVSPWIGDNAGYVQVRTEPSVPPELQESAEKEVEEQEQRAPEPGPAPEEQPADEREAAGGDDDSRGRTDQDATGGGDVPDAGTAAEAVGGEFWFWAEVTDREQAESFIAGDAAEVRSEEHAGTEISVVQSDGQTRAWAFVEEDELLLVGNTEQAIRTALDTREGGDGDITQNDAVMGVAEEVDDDSIVSVVVSGDGVRQQMEADEAAGGQGAGADQALQSLRESRRVQAMHGISMGLLAEDAGMRLRGFVGYDGGELGEDGLGANFEPTLVDQLPADTALAIGGRDFGGAVEAMIEVMRDDPQNAQQVAQVEAALGVSAEDIGATFDDQFALAFLGTTGETDGIAPFVGLVMETDDEERANEIITSVMRGASAQGGNPVREEEVAGVDTVQANVGLANLVGATFDGQAVLTTSETFLQALRAGETTLGDDELFTSVRDDAGAPDEVAGMVYMQTATVRDVFVAFGLDRSLLGADLTDRGTTAGPAFGWLENDDDSQRFELFMQVADRGDGDGGAGTTVEEDDAATPTGTIAGEQDEPAGTATIAE